MAIPALLDACVLYPVGLRDTLLNVAEAGYFRVLWSEDILAETSRNIVEDVPDLTAKHLEKTFAAMRQAFPEAAVRGYEHLVDSMPNHPKDRHVLAAAVLGDAEVLVTNNLRHFPSEACEPLGVRVESPDDFLVEMNDCAPPCLGDQAFRHRRQHQGADAPARPRLSRAALRYQHATAERDGAIAEGINRPIEAARAEPSAAVVNLARTVSGAVE